MKRPHSPPLPENHHIEAAYIGSPRFKQNPGFTAPIRVEAFDPDRARSAEIDGTRGPHVY